MLRVSWAWNNVERWPDAATVDSTFNPSGKTGYTHGTDPYAYWDGDPVSESEVQYPATAIWIAEGLWTDLSGSDANTDYGWNIGHAGNVNWNVNGFNVPGYYVRGRHNGTFNSVYGDGHAKSHAWNSTKPGDWSIQGTQ